MGKKIKTIVSGILSLLALVLVAYLFYLLIKTGDVDEFVKLVWEKIGGLSI